MLILSITNARYSINAVIFFKAIENAPQDVVANLAGAAVLDEAIRQFAVSIRALYEYE